MYIMIGKNNGGNAQIIMSGTRSGHTWNYIGYAIDGSWNYPTPYLKLLQILEIGTMTLQGYILTLNPDSNEVIQIMMIVICF